MRAGNSADPHSPFNTVGDGFPVPAVLGLVLHILPANSQALTDWNMTAYEFDGFRDGKPVPYIHLSTVPPNGILFSLPFGITLGIMKKRGSL